MKIDHATKNVAGPNKTHTLTFTGTTQEFQIILEALSLSPDQRVIDICTFIQKKIPNR